jgi:hypothetical protein
MPPIRIKRVHFLDIKLDIWDARERAAKVIMALAPDWSKWLLGPEGSEERPLAVYEDEHGTAMLVSSPLY